MKLRSRVYGDSIISTKFDTYTALRRAIEEQEAMRLLSDDEEAEISDTEAITAAFRELGVISGRPAGHKRQRSSSAPPTPNAHVLSSSIPSTHSSGSGSRTSVTASNRKAPCNAPQTRAQAAKTTIVEPSSDETAATEGDQSHRNKRRRLKRREDRVVEKLKPMLKRSLSLVGMMKEEDTGTPIAAENLPAAGGGYTALVDRNKPKPQTENYTKLVKAGFKLIEWDGKTPTAVKDIEEKVIVMLAGQPDAKNWDASCKHVYDLMMKKGEALPRGTKYCDHVRGSFPAINVGVTHGKGSTAPHTLNHGDRVKEIVYEIIEDREMRRLATFQSSAFRTWAPKLYRHYEDYMDRLWSHELINKDGRLRRNFPNSVFPCIALNFGPKVWTKRHRDTKNIPYGWCAITALGICIPG